MKPPSDNPLLDIGPFREWITRQVAIVGGRTQLAVMIGRTERQVWGWMCDPRSETVTLDNVDQTGVTYGEPMLLRQLYPHLYDLPEWLDSDEVAA